MNKQDVLQLFDKHYGDRYKVYLPSIKSEKNNYFFMVEDNHNKYLVVVGTREICKDFEGYNLEEIEIDKNGLFLKVCYINHHNLSLLRETFPLLNPSFCGLRASFGTGDRLGIATPAHIQAFAGKDIFPILAQQSVREMSRTGRNWQKVLDNTIWGCFEAGYEGPFGADADHVKDIKELKEAADCGFTMFTLDPSDFISKDIEELNEQELNQLYNKIPKNKEIEKLYLNEKFKVGEQELIFDEKSLRKIMLTYSEALNHVVECYEFLKDYKKEKFDLEISVDETPTVTSPLAHLFIVLELQRRGVDLQNLALHFLGDWQKGIEYIGDVKQFAREFSLHAAIAKNIRGYKLSLHTGSDKFSVYPIFSQETDGLCHIKTAGTSWLEEVKVVAMKDPALYREIHRFALENFAKDRASYNLTTDLSRIPDIDTISDDELINLFKQNDSRQLIHITYGSILRAKNNEGKYIFKDRIYKILFEYEEDHYRELSNHIRRHLELLIK
ncbi:MAG: tagaturonate epimerase family protein [Candidatus Caldatribacteriota bacterium]|nr:tagaturonate epimerase family protein [Candidatus Caldatribacteriota bacterium]